MSDILEQGAVLVLDEIVRRAIRAKASDVHLEPKRERLNVRFRVDGEMIEEQSVPPDIALEVVSRIKVLARMDIAERRVPQDGQLTLAPDGGAVHLRASTFPSSLGEKVVLRLLSGGALIPFEKLGLDPITQAIVRELVDRPQGFIVTSGPTGAGKTSTLYSFMRLIDTRRTNVMTLEDPIEIELPQITQGQTNAKAGFTFATGLRAILRQDPDVIMVGEIRDEETAQVAIEASLTGHLVLSTLHTNSAAETVTRLLDMGMDPFNFADALLAVLAQRLVRRMCPNCKVSEPALNNWRDELLHDYIHAFQGAESAPDEDAVLAGWARHGRLMRHRCNGCEQCAGSGLRGRLGLHELMTVSRGLREKIQAGKRSDELLHHALGDGMRTLRHDGIDKVWAGLSTIEEVRANS